MGRFDKGPTLKMLNFSFHIGSTVVHQPHYISICHFGNGSCFDVLHHVMSMIRVRKDRSDFFSVAPIPKFLARFS